MRRQVLLAFVVVVVFAPLFVVVKDADGTLRPVWAKARPAQVEAPVDEEPTSTADILYVDVADAGDTSYNGQYSPAGDYNGKTYYAKAEAERYLWYSVIYGPPEDPDPVEHWVLGDTVGSTGIIVAYISTQYGGAVPANPWQCVLGTPPAPTPTVTEGDGGGHGGGMGASVGVAITDSSHAPETVAGVIDITVDVWRTATGSETEGGWGGDWTVHELCQVRESADYDRTEDDDEPLPITERYAREMAAKARATIARK